MRVYVAGPMSLGDHDLNIRRGIDAAQALLEAGHSPYLPHLTSFWNIVHTNPHGRWLALDRDWLKCCDALIRLPGESKGADQEVEWAIGHRIPVFHSVEEFLGTDEFLPNDLRR